MSYPPPPSDPPPFDPTRPFDAGQPFDPTQRFDPAQPGRQGEPYQQAQPSPPQPPTYQRGYAQAGYPQTGYPQADHGGYPQADQGGHSPTASFPAYDPVQSAGTPGAPGPPAPRRSNVPLVAVIMAVTVLLCGGTAFAGVLAARYVTDRAKEAVEPITTLPTVPTALPTLPTELPTELPQLPGLPTDHEGAPSVPDPETKIRVRYEVTGDGPADITYIEKLGETPKRIKKAELPWRKEVSMTGATLVSVVAFRIDSSEGSIRCRVTVDGEQVAERDATGSLAVVTCSKLVLG